MSDKNSAAACSMSVFDDQLKGHIPGLFPFCLQTDPRQQDLEEGPGLFPPRYKLPAALRVLEAARDIEEDGEDFLGFLQSEEGGREKNQSSFVFLKFQGDTERLEFLAFFT